MISIVYEDEYLLGINKQPFSVVNRAHTVKGETIQDQVEAYLDIDFKSNDLHDIFKKRSGMVHRLDKNTSGILMWAKTGEAMFGMMRMFKVREVEKMYTALAHGNIEPVEGNIKVPLGRLPQDKTKFGVVVGGKMSETRYRKESTYTYENNVYSLVRLFPKTGRTHQLRVVLKHLGYPIVADSYYLSKKRSQSDEKLLDRHFLHASKISFEHPITHKKLEIEAPLSTDLSNLLEKMS